LGLRLQDYKEVNVEVISELPLQKLRVKYRHSAAGEESPLFLSFQKTLKK
jgi:hypothetical protein